MVLTYFKRYRMQIDVATRDLSWPPVPSGYRLLGWNRSLLELHARVKYQSFRDELDAHVFTCFHNLEGCRRLMDEISRKGDFVPEATWLAVYVGDGSEPPEYCGTVQGLRDRSGVGSVQNVGVTAEHRGRGLGSAMLYRSLDGFRRAGVAHVALEVTADNHGAIRLYRRLGFRIIKTVYKVADLDSLD